MLIGSNLLKPIGWRWLRRIHLCLQMLTHWHSMMQIDSSSLKQIGSNLLKPIRSSLQMLIDLRSLKLIG